jgi:hypothetical protein
MLDLLPLQLAFDWRGQCSWLWRWVYLKAIKDEIVIALGFFNYLLRGTNKRELLQLCKYLIILLYLGL